MPIKTRIVLLIGGFGLIAAIVAILGVRTLHDYDRMMRDYGTAYENAYIGEKLNRTISVAVMESRGVYLARTQPEIDTYADSLEDQLDAIPALLAAWRQSLPEHHRGPFQTIENEASAFLDVRHELVRLARSGKVGEAAALGINSRSSRQEFQAHIAELVAMTRDDLADAKVTASEFNTRRTGEFLAMAALSVVLCLIMAAWLINRFITAPLLSIADAIVRTARRDYSVDIPASSGDDEMSRVWRAISIFRDTSIENERLMAEQRSQAERKEMELRQIMLD